MEWIIGIGLFIAAILIVEGIILFLRPKWDPESRTIEKRLERVADSATGQKEIDITRRRQLSEVPKLNAILSRIPVMHNLDELVVQANVRLPLGFFLLLAIAIVLIVYLLLSLTMRQHFLPAVIGVIAATAPFLYLSIKKTQRMKKFERQLPDALDLMARSLKAGHAFSGGLQMVAEEFDEPIGTEFFRVMNEINYGMPVDQALKNMAARVDVPDLKFFTVSVIIQRESGGNLAEILESIARLIRERFKLLGKIKALSAEGKLTAIILTVLPFIVVLVISMINPKYLPVLLEDPAGRIMVITALCMMAFGVFLIRKLIRIEV